MPADAIDDGYGGSATGHVVTLHVTATRTPAAPDRSHTCPDLVDSSTPSNVPSNRSHATPTACRGGSPTSSTSRDPCSTALATVWSLGGAQREENSGDGQCPWSVRPRSSSARRSAAAMTGRFVFARGTSGKIDASATYRLSMPMTRPPASTTDRGRRRSPIRQVPQMCAASPTVSSASGRWSRRHRAHRRLDRRGRWRRARPPPRTPVGRAARARGGSRRAVGLDRSVRGAGWS